MPRSLARPVWPSWGWLDAISAADPRAPPPTGAVRASTLSHARHHGVLPHPACLLWRRLTIRLTVPVLVAKTSLSVVNLSAARRPRGNQNTGQDGTGLDWTGQDGRLQELGDEPGDDKPCTPGLLLQYCVWGADSTRLDSTRARGGGGGGGVDRWLTCHSPRGKW